MLGSQCSPCCEGGNPCAQTRKRITITISGLPSIYDTRKLLMNREVADDACSYTLFRVRDSVQPQSCKYSTVWHAATNYYSSADKSANRITLDITANVLDLQLFGGALIVRLRPPTGKTFQSFPFDEVLIPQITQKIGVTAATEDFASVRVIIDDRTAEYIPFVCPDNSRFSTAFYGSCISGVHTLPQYSRTYTQTGYTDTGAFPIYGCKPCESNYHTSYTSTVTRDPNCQNSGDAASSGCPTVTTYSSDVPDLIVNASFAGPNIAGYSMSPLSGTYALKWQSGVRIGTASYEGLYFQTFQGLQDVDSSGNGKPIGEQFLFPSSNPAEPAEQGWKIDFRAPPADNRQLGMILVVAPVKATTAINVAARTIVSTPCDTGQFAYQVKLAVFMRNPPSPTYDDYAYWRWELSAYANVPCAPRKCRGVPSVSLNAAETIYLPLVPPWYDSRGKLGQVTVSISSQT